MSNLRHDIRRALAQEQDGLGDIRGVRQRLMQGAMASRGATHRPINLVAGIAAIVLAVMVIATFAYIRAGSRPRVTPASAPRVSTTTPTPSTRAFPVDTSPPAFFFNLKANKDFYSWDGTLVRRLEATTDIRIASQDGRYYTDSIGRIWTAGGVQSGAMPLWPSSYHWAADGDYLCGTGKDSSGGYAMYVTDVQGHSRLYPLSGRGQAGVFGCSKNTNRTALVSGEGGYTLTVLSLIDGHVERTIALNSGGYLNVSPDVNWVAQSITQPAPNFETEIIDLRDGTVKARLTNATAVTFTPDSQYLVVNDFKTSRIKMVDWRTGDTVWSSPGYSRMVVAISDPSTNRMVLEIGTGSDSLGTYKGEYWIVTGTGTATQFTPRP